MTHTPFSVNVHNLYSVVTLILPQLGEISSNIQDVKKRLHIRKGKDMFIAMINAIVVIRGLMLKNMAAHICA